jgi:hypothetical protein
VDCLRKLECCLRRSCFRSHPSGLLSNPFPNAIKDGEPAGFWVRRTVPGLRRTCSEPEFGGGVVPEKGPAPLVEDPPVWEAWH